MEIRVKSNNFIKYLVFFALVLPISLFGSWDSFVHGIKKTADRAGHDIKGIPHDIKGIPSDIKDLTNKEVDHIKSNLINYVKKDPLRAIKNLYNCTITRSILANCGIAGKNWGACAANVSKNGFNNPHFKGLKKAIHDLRFSASILSNKSCQKLLDVAAKP